MPEDAAEAVAGSGPIDQNTDPYTSAQRALQEHYGTRRLADRLAAFATPTVTGATKDFVESRDFFFLASVDPDGMPTCSFKGGPAGFVQVVDDGRTLVFPGYDGNGMFLSLGNVAATGKVGLLFIDFEHPNRVRVQGVATLHHDDPLLAEAPGAQVIVRVAVERAFVNCARYIPTMHRVHESPSTPQPGATPRFAAWKRLEVFRDVLPAHDAAIAADLPPLSFEEYLANPE